MIFLLYINNFNSYHVQFSEQKNNIIIPGKFTKTYYSTENFILNNIYLNFDIKCIEINKCDSYLNDKNSDKYIMNFNIEDNSELLQKFIDIEKNILEYYMKYHDISDKIPEYILKNHITNKKMKFYKNSEMKNYFLKISGIWENNSHFGITYKILDY